MALRVQDRAGTIFCTHEADSAADYANAPNGVTIWTLNGEIVRKTATGAIVPLFTEQGTSAGGTGTGTFSGVEEEVFTSTPYTTLAPTTLKNIINVFWNGWPQERPNTGNTIGDYDHTVNPDGRITINGDPMQVGGGRGKILYVATGAATVLQTPPAPASQQVDDVKDTWTVALVSGYPNIADYEYEQINTVATTPAAPTGAVTDDAANTFDWTNNPTYPNIADYEYTMNGGTSYANVTAKPQPVGNVALAIGQVGVRVKAGTNTTASATLFNTVAFTVAAVAPTVYHLSEFTGAAGTPMGSYVPETGNPWAAPGGFVENDTLDGAGNVQTNSPGYTVRRSASTQANAIGKVTINAMPIDTQYAFSLRKTAAHEILGMVHRNAGGEIVFYILLDGVIMATSAITTFVADEVLTFTADGATLSVNYRGQTLNYTTDKLTTDFFYMWGNGAGIKINRIQVTSL